jgi:circadian clock protein KaiC
VFTGGAGRTAEDLEFVCDGHLQLRQTAKGRVLAVTKFRGSDYRPGQHTARIGGDGMTVSPKLVPESHTRDFDDERIGSGIEGLDEMTEGGITRGTVTVISGPSGVGKSTLGSHFLKQAAERDERSVIYLLEEGETTFRHRSETIGVAVDEMVETGSLAIEEVETLTISADEFAARVRAEVERRDARVVMIDGIAGYRLAIKGEEEELRTELHALVRYLRNMGVTVVLTGETPLVTDDLSVTEESISYLADNVLLLRYFEAEGALQKALGVLKMRASDFERGLREFAITGDGVQVGERLDRFRGVLTGVPERHE